MDKNHYYKNKPIIDLKFLLVFITLIFLTSAVFENSVLSTELVLGANPNHHHNQNKRSLNTDKIRSSQSEFNQIPPKTLKIKHSADRATTVANGINNNRFIVTNTNNKIVILTFGDVHKSQYTTARPILDQYGFKGSFFVTCDLVNSKSADIKNNNNKLTRMSWSDISALQQDGQDIESKGMTHRDLNLLPPKELDFEIGGSKQCLENHGVNSPNIFAVVHGDAWANQTVVNTISKYYGFADNGFADLMFLHCDGYPVHKQTDCRTYDDSGALTYANRYSIREDSHNAWDQNYLHNDPIIFQKFVQQVNSQTAYNNKKGFVDAIPIVAYHSIDNSQASSSTDVNLFAAEMKYLYDNGFKVIPMSDLGYDESTNYMYIRNG